MAFDSMLKGKMEQIFRAYGLLRETVASIIMHYKNTTLKVRSPNGDIDFFDIVAGVLQGETLTPYQFIICRDYVFQTSIDLMKENGYTLEKAKSKRYPARSITGADYADDKALLANKPTQAESLVHRVERAAAGRGLHVNTDKTEYICFNQSGDISTPNGGSLKLVDKLTYLGSSISSTENDISTRLAKPWTATDRLSVIW